MYTRFEAKPSFLMASKRDSHLLFENLFRGKDSILKYVGCRERRLESLLEKLNFMMGTGCMKLC